MATRQRKPPNASKWLHQLDAEMPVVEAARSALLHRLEHLHELVPGVRESWQDSSEWVHQLRVTSRRTGAALEFFRNVLPRRRRKRAQRRLRHLRKAADQARNIDVLLARLDHADELSENTRQPAIQRLKAQRLKAQKPIADMADRFEVKQWSRKDLRLIDHARWPRKNQGGQPDFRSFAQEQWHHRIGRFGRLLESEHDTVQAKHALRIGAKEVRYTLELLSTVMPERFREEVYPEFVQLQGYLGELNDHATALELLGQLLHVDPDHPPEDWTPLVEYHTRELTKLDRQFPELWPAERFGRLRHDLQQLGSG